MTMLVNLLYKLYKKSKNRLKSYLYKKDALYSLKRSKVLFPDDIKFNGECYINILGKATIGDSFTCNSSLDGCIDYGKSKIVVGPKGELSIGHNSGITNVCIHCHNKIEIGDYVNIGAGTMIFDTNFHSTNWLDRENLKTDISNAKTAPVHIGNYVFIGAHSIIGKGVRIGDKAIVAAGSVVVCDIPAGEVWGENPCRYIKKID